jgi:HSP20 family protein
MLPRKRYLAPDLADFFGSVGRLVNFEEDWGSAPRLEIDVEDKPECFEIKANLPEVKKEDVNIDLEGNRLTISVTQSENKESSGKNYLIKERRSGYAARTLALPAEITHDDISASLRDGVLYVSVRKQAEKQNKKIAVS